MHRRTKDYLDEICFWQCARSRLLQRTALLRERSPETDASREPLDELLHRCGLDALRRSSKQDSLTSPGSTGTTPPAESEA